MLHHLPLFASLVRRTVAGLPGRYRQYALPACAWLLLALTVTIVLFTNDPPWPVNLHIAFVGSMT